MRVLDHGYVEYVEHMGSDERIIESARMSTGGGFVSWEPYEDHPRATRVCSDTSTPRSTRHLFEMCTLTVEVCAPIFVYRQWHRHRTQSYNEASARYMPLPDVNYVPSVERLMVNGGKNKQARGSVDVTLTAEHAAVFRRALQQQYDAAESLYQEALAAGVPKELARVHLPVARYSTMRASANLLNWLRFLRLRLDPHAQWEIREYAKALGTLLAHHYPRTWALFAAEMKL